MIKKTKNNYGTELIIDLHDCDSAKFTRKHLKRYFVELCDLIDMERCKLSWFDDHGVHPDEQQTEPHLKGTTAVQFIMTSNIVIHTLDLLGAVYVNIFSCKDFDPEVAADFTAKWFKGKIVNSHLIDRI